MEKIQALLPMNSPKPKARSPLTQRKSVENEITLPCVHTSVKNNIHSGENEITLPCVHTSVKNNIDSDIPIVIPRVLPERVSVSTSNIDPNVFLIDAVSELQDQSVAIHDELKNLSFIVNEMNLKMANFKKILKN
jgi:hypothetical protein